MAKATTTEQSRKIWSAELEKAVQDLFDLIWLCDLRAESSFRLFIVIPRLQRTSIMNICYFPGQCIGKSCTCVLSMNMINPNWFVDMNEFPGNLKCIAPGITGRLSSQILFHFDNSYTVAGKPEKNFPSRFCTES